MHAQVYFPNCFLIILCYLGAFSDIDKPNAFSDIGVVGVPQRAVFLHFPLINADGKRLDLGSERTYKENWFDLEHTLSILAFRLWTTNWIKGLNFL